MTDEKSGTVLGVDFGLSRTGLAFGSGETRIAFAGPILTGDPDDLIPEIAREAAERGASTIVVGLPRNMDGSEGEMGERVRAFAEKLREAAEADVVLWDERLTSRQADRAMLQGNLSRKKRKKRIDSLAAQLMLQSYLDTQKLPPE